MRDANKDSGKNGLHEGRSNLNEHQIGGRQPRNHLRGRKDTNNGPSHGRTRSLDELPDGRELGIVLRHTGIGLCLFAGTSAEEGQRKDWILMLIGVLPAEENAL